LAITPNVETGQVELGPLDFGLSIGERGVTAPAPAGLDGNPFAPRRPFVALVHGTSRLDKQWPLEHWITIGQRLNHSGFAVALAQGSETERLTSERIASELADAWVWPTMTLDALTDTMARCAGVIGVDSGLSHIAVALGLPHVQIYNFDTAWRTGPLDGRLLAAKQVSVFASPQPDIDAVWQAWEALDTPVLCR
jgi:heptosyltransferase-1